MNEQIICQDLALGYGGHVVAQGLSFAIQAGQYVCVVGENGAGKSTLLRTLLGLQPPLAGSTLLAQCKPGDVGYLPQQKPAQRDFPAAVQEVVLSGCLGRCGLYPFYRPADKARAQAALAQLGIAPLASRCYRALSGGQQQRVLLARALCAARRLLVLDEPVAGLDPQTTREMYAHIAQMNRQGVTVLMVTHDVENALPYASHVLRLGKRVWFGPAGGDTPWA